MMILQQRQRDGQAPTETWQARITVRIPRNDGTDLLADATRRFEKPTPVESVEVDELCGVEPALSATVVRLDVRLTTAADLDSSELETRLADAPGIESITGLERA